MHWLTRFHKALTSVEIALLALLLVGMVLLATLQVVLRNFADTTLVWGTTVLQNATLLVGLLGAAVATAENRHLSVDALSRLITGRASLGVRVGIGLFALLGCGLLVRGGWTIFDNSLHVWLRNLPAGWSIPDGIHIEVAEGMIPSWLTHAILPLGFGLIGVHFGLRLLRDGADLLTGRLPEDSPTTDATDATDDEPSTDRALPPSGDSSPEHEAGQS